MIFVESYVFLAISTMFFNKVFLTRLALHTTAWFSISQGDGHDLVQTNQCPAIEASNKMTSF